MRRAIANIPKSKLRCLHKSIKNLIPGIEVSVKSNEVNMTMNFKKPKNFNDFFYSFDRFVSTEESLGSKRRKVGNFKFQTTLSSRYLNLEISDLKVEQVENLFDKQRQPILPAKPKLIMGDLVDVEAETKRDLAAIMLQKVYKSYRTRRYFADWAVICEELWWKATIPNAFQSYFIKWERSRTMAAKTGRSLPKYGERSQRLALRHWLEAIDPRHRYGQNLHFYYDVWFQSRSSQPFFFWLDVGDGKLVDLPEKCSRKKLQCQRVKYLGPEEREAYEVIVEKGKLVYKQSEELVHTTEGSKWIFVLSPSRTLYVGQKDKGHFQHSSFLAGGATIASGRMVAHNGVLRVIWPYSGHYRPTAKHFMEFICFLEDHNVDMTHVKKHPVDDDVPPVNEEYLLRYNNGRSSNSTTASDDGQQKVDKNKSVLSKWSTGVGPRICCVNDYSQGLKDQALKQLNLSPKLVVGRKNRPIPFPRPSPTLHLSPWLANLGICNS